MVDIINNAVQRAFKFILKDKIKLNYKCPKGTVDPNTFECPDKEVDSSKGKRSAPAPPAKQSGLSEGPTNMMADDPDILRAKDAQSLMKVARAKIPNMKINLEDRIKEGSISFKNAKNIVMHAKRLSDAFPILSRSGFRVYIGACNGADVPCDKEEKNGIPVNGINVPRGTIAFAKYFMHSTPSIIFNPEYHRSDALSWNDMSKEERANGYRMIRAPNEDPRWLVGLDINSKSEVAPIEVTLAHELGHLVDHMLSGDALIDFKKVKDDFGNDFDIIKKTLYVSEERLTTYHFIIVLNTELDRFMNKSNSSRREFMREVSQYALKNTRERFAEMFAMYTIQPPEERGPAMQIFAKYMKVLLNEKYYKNV
mgnify:CR=1 FL=1